MGYYEVHDQHKFIKSVSENQPSLISG
jgi:hypothetical protein